MNFLALIVALALLGAAPLARPAAAQSSPPALGAEVTDAEEFLRLVWSTGRFGVTAGRIAEARADDARLADLSASLIEDYGAIANDLARTATEMGLALPGEMEPAHRALLDRLRGAEEFDPAYLEAQVDAHEWAVGMFRHFAQNAPDDPMRRFATRTLPVLEEHLQRIRTLHLGHDRT